MDDYLLCDRVEIDTIEEYVQLAKKYDAANIRFSLLNSDKQIISEFIGISIDELNRCVEIPPMEERYYKRSWLNELYPIARRIRRFIE